MISADSEHVQERRRYPGTAAITITAITSFATAGDEQKAKEARATVYLAKPYSPRDLPEMIRKLVPEGGGPHDESAAPWLMVAVLVLSPGCVKQADWIESTPVTVDVTGTWGTVDSPLSPGFGAGVMPGVAHLELEQEGPMVKGLSNIKPSNPRVHLKACGRDVFHFTVAGGLGEVLTGDVTVSGDEMEGWIKLSDLCRCPSGREDFPTPAPFASALPNPEPMISVTCLGFVVRGHNHRGPSCSEHRLAMPRDRPERLIGMFKREGLWV